MGGWEGNRSFGIALVTRTDISGSPTYGLKA